MKKQFWYVVLLIVFLDQISKIMAREWSIDLGIFAINHYANTGISFGLFKGHNLFFLLVSFIILCLIIYLYFLNNKYWLQFGLIAGGTIGNLIDRIVYGYVNDFIDFRFFPVFNIADAAITAGALYLFLVLTLNKEDLKSR